MNSTEGSRKDKDSTIPSFLCVSVQDHLQRPSCVNVHHSGQDHLEEWQREQGLRTYAIQPFEAERTRGTDEDNQHKAVTWT